MATTRDSQVIEESGNEEPTIGELMELVRKQGEELAALRKQATSRQFIPMQKAQEPRRGGYVPPEQLQANMKSLLGGASDEVVGGYSNIYDDPKRRPFPAVFRSGSQVRVNPDATVWGTDPPRTWREAIASSKRKGLNVEALYGEVYTIMGRSRSGEPKYKVVIKGFTSANGDGFRESELLPA